MLLVGWLIQKTFTCVTPKALYPLVLIVKPFPMRSDHLFNRLGCWALVEEITAWTARSSGRYTFQLHLSFVGLARYLLLNGSIHRFHPVIARLLLGGGASFLVYPIKHKTCQFVLTQGSLSLALIISYKIRTISSPKRCWALVGKLLLEYSFPSR